MATYKTPGVYIEESGAFPRSIASVETAIPVFIGYTEKAEWKAADDLRDIPHRIQSLHAFEELFGRSPLAHGLAVSVDTSVSPARIQPSLPQASPYQMRHAVEAFFAHGGSTCYIVSVGNDTATVTATDLERGLDQAGKVDEITLTVFPDSQGLPDAATYYVLQNASLRQSAQLGDRMALIDVWAHDDHAFNDIGVLRNTLTSDINILRYGAAYYPRLEMRLSINYDPDTVNVSMGGSTIALSVLESQNVKLYKRIREAIEKDLTVILQPSAAIAGIYARVDGTRGVWKAPANVEISGSPVVQISNADQEELNVDPVSGKSVNAIRTFPGRGTIVWGARTLAGNDNEWRYVPVRRFVNMVEESVKKGTAPFVFEPNDANTWAQIKAMIENYLMLQWRAGALAGAQPGHAFFVKVGLGETMTATDILEGRLIIESGMAVVRPAEFIILHFSHKMAES